LDDPLIHFDDLNTYAFLDLIVEHLSLDSSFFAISQFQGEGASVIWYDILYRLASRGSTWTKKCVW